MSCCKNDSESVRTTVREGYARIADRASSEGCCSRQDPRRLAEAVGYDSAELESLPEGANMGLSCGNPVALAELRPGDVVVDLGSGGGFDVFNAGRRVGPDGRAIGVDMTSEMLGRARQNAASYRESTGWTNVEFRLGEIEHLPVADGSADVVISNCVINLSPDKPQVWTEMARILKPGGRVSVSDLALLRPLPDGISRMVEALVGCVAGAVLVEDTQRMARDAGFEEITATPRADYIRSMQNWEDPLYRSIAEHLPESESVADYITSLSITAIKPLDPIAG